MCGITGFFNSAWAFPELEKITDCLAHRGPDAKGYFFDPSKGIALGHRRLSILDLSTAGNQPFYSRDCRYIMVYNGEVYNYKEVAAKYNIQSRTSSDTEIILEAFALVGIDCLNDFNGMFSFAIWDTVQAKLFLVRDRIGIKPLYYTESKQEFAFASELKAIFSLPFKKEINQDSVSNFLHLGYIPGEDTIYRGCKKLKPGHFAVVDKDGIVTKAYWELEKKLLRETLTDEKLAKKQLKTLVETSVNYSMISDVPLGVFLSGGVDSSLVAAVAQSLSDLPIQTYSIAFQEEKHNEAKYAQQVAGLIHSGHHEFLVTQKEAVELADSLLDVYDEPYADSSAIPTLMLSELTRKHVTVALSGDGGDELFMGYGFYYWARRLSNPVLAAFRKPVGQLLNASGNNRMQRAAKMFEYESMAKRKSHIFSQEQYYFSEKELRQLLIHPAGAGIDEELHFNGRKLTAAEEQSFFDLNNYLPEELLVKTDRASMHHSLEVRVPLLDYRMIEFAINLSPDLKLRGNTGKYLLKQVLYDYLPESIFARPKQGFSVPLVAWLKGDLKYLLDRYLNETILVESKLVNPALALQLKQDFLSGKDYLYTRVWALVILHKWFKEKHS